jgi:outer membrane protein assembly factor BamD (BamD/ComL family)
MDFDFTPAAELPPLQEHPFYTEGMAQIASGQWQQASQSLQLLQGIYPDSAEVQELLDQVQMRAALAQFQPKHSSRATKRLNGRRLIVGALMAMILIIAGYVVYEMWINPMIVQELRLRQITSLRKEADEAIETGDYARAHQALQKLEAILPGDARTIEALRQVDQVERLAALYAEAKALMAAGSWDQAIESLTELQRLDPQYRDLPQLMQVARESQSMEKQFQAAEEAFASNDWASAIAQYEAIREASLTFRFEEVQAQLFESHLNYGQMLLAEAETDPNLVAEALVHFSEALKLRPVDAGALDERHLAETYLAALNSDDQDQVIDLLQTIYNEQPGYAGKGVAQLLYTNLLERADASLESGDEAAAAADYQVAAQLLVEDPSQAQEKLSEIASEMSPQ